MCIIYIISMFYICWVCKLNVSCLYHFLDKAWKVIAEFTFIVVGVKENINRLQKKQYWFEEIMNLFCSTVTTFFNLVVTTLIRSVVLNTCSYMCNVYWCMNMYEVWLCFSYVYVYSIWPVREIILRSCKFTSWKKKILMKDSTFVMYM